MQRLIIIFIAFFLFLGNVFAQERDGTITGTVVEKDTKEPMALPM